MVVVTVGEPVTGADGLVIGGLPAGGVGGVVGVVGVVAVVVVVVVGVAGPRPLVLGERPVASGERPLVPGARPVASGDRPLVPGARPVASGDRPLVPGATPLVTGAGMLALCSMALASAERPLVPGTRPLGAIGARPLVLGVRALALGGRPVVPGARPLALGERPLVLGARPLALGARPLVLGAMPLALGARPLVLGAMPVTPVPIVPIVTPPGAIAPDAPTVPLVIAPPAVPTRAAWAYTAPLSANGAANPTDCNSSFVRMPIGTASCVLSPADFTPAGSVEPTFVRLATDGASAACCKRGDTHLRLGRLRMRSIGWALLTLVAACATTPPVQQLSAASASVGAAREAGADSDIQANAYLIKARQELAQARSAMDAGDNKAANGLLIRARADGELAAAVAREARFRVQADDLTRRADALRHQTQM